MNFVFCHRILIKCEELYVASFGDLEILIFALLIRGWALCPKTCVMPHATIMIRPMILSKLNNKLVQTSQRVIVHTIGSFDVSQNLSEKRRKKNYLIKLEYLFMQIFINMLHYCCCRLIWLIYIIAYRPALVGVITNYVTY